MLIGFFVLSEFDWRNYLQRHKKGIMGDFMEFNGLQSSSKKGFGLI